MGRRPAALDVQSGRVIGECHRRRRSIELCQFLHNDGTHKTPLIRRWLAKRPRFHVRFTPTCASWLNLVERWFATLTVKQIRRGRHRSTCALEKAIRTYFRVSNENPKLFVWTKTADLIPGFIAPLL